MIATVPRQVDPTKTPIWFGAPERPEKVDAAIAQSERASAEQAGIKPFPKDKVEAALAKGGEPIEAPDKSTLLRDQIAPLILEYCSDEKYLADGFRVPVVTKRISEKRTDDED
jgi:hypothetical protein